MNVLINEKAARRQADEAAPVYGPSAGVSLKALGGHEAPQLSYGAQYAQAVKLIEKLAIEREQGLTDWQYWHKAERVADEILTLSTQAGPQDAPKIVGLARELLKEIIELLRDRPSADVEPKPEPSYKELRAKWIEESKE